MRQKAILALSALLFLILIFSGCELFQCNCICDNYDAEELTLNDTVELRYNELYCSSEYEFRLAFDSLSDSRCPIGMACFWEGNASVRLSIIQEGEESNTFTLNTHGNFLTDTVANDLRFELIDILPYPEAYKDYQLDDYILLMHISD